MTDLRINISELIALGLPSRVFVVLEFPERDTPTPPRIEGLFASRGEAIAAAINRAAKVYPDFCLWRRRRMITRTSSVTPRDLIRPYEQEWHVIVQGVRNEKVSSLLGLADH